MSVFQWSTTPATNSNIDPTINLSTGRAPSSVTPADRSALAALAGYRMDVSGAMKDTGVANAYLLTSASNYNQITGGQTALQTLGNNQIAFTPATSNTGTSTLSIDGLGPFPLRSAPNVELQGGSLIAGSPVSCLFNFTDNAFYLLNIYSAPVGIPIGGMIDYTGSTSPFSNWVIPVGQQLSITTYASLFALYGPNRYGTDTSSLFFLPDLRGRVVAMLDPTGLILTSVTMTPDGKTLGATGGIESETLTALQIPDIHSAVSVSVSGGISGTTSGLFNAGVNGSAINTTATNIGGAGTIAPLSVSGSFSGSGTGTASSTNTGDQSHPNVQPTLLLNKLLRVQ